jgi:hypothetical protein
VSYIYGAPCKARNFNVVYIWTYVWQRWKPYLSICCTMFQRWINAESFPVSQLRVNTLLATKVTLIANGIHFGSLRVNVLLNTTGMYRTSLWRNWEQIEVREWLLSLGAEYFVFSLTLQKYKDWDIQGIILLVLYGCETWPPTLRVKHRLRICEKGPRTIFGPKRYEVTGDWSWMHSEELRDWYSSQNIVWWDQGEWGGQGM